MAVTSDEGYETSKQVIDWSSFFAESNVPCIGYDSVNNMLVILKGSKNSADSSKDILVYDFRTGSWVKGDTKIGNNSNLSNMFSDPLNGQLQIMKNIVTGASLERFYPYSQSSTTVNIQTPFYDFGTAGIKKKLYKVKVNCHGENLDDLAIQGAYDGGSYANIFGGSPQLFTNTLAGEWTTQVFTIASPTKFNTFSLKIYAAAATGDVDWGISEISFIYREMGMR